MKNSYGWFMANKAGRRKCYLCDSKIGVHRHHIKPRRDGGIDEARNIVYLCENCHNLVEENPSLLSKRQHHILNLTQDKEGFPYYVVVTQNGAPFLIGVCHSWGMEYILKPLTQRNI